MTPAATSRFLALVALVFFSGASALVYQAVWQRLLSIAFGVTTFATSTVLAAFMGGLALGSLLAAPLLRRIRRPLRAFGFAEILIGVSALATPLGLTAADKLYGLAHAVAPDSFVGLTLARLVGSSLLLLVPTMLMGMTLPLVAASRLVRGAGFARRVSLVYGVNTVGGLAGLLASGFFLIGSQGMRVTILLAALVNLGVGLLVLVLARGEAESVEPEADGAAAAPASLPPHTRRLVLAVMGVSGCAALALEVVWFRILVQFVASTTYAFTAMLAVVLAGIGGGAVLAAWLRRYARDGVAWLAALQLATAIAVVASFTVFASDYRAGPQVVAPLEVSLAIVFPAALLMGVSFPLALDVFATPGAGSALGAAARVGRLYAVNTLGAIVGALVAGFLLAPMLGSRLSLVLGAAAFALTGAALAAASSSRALRAAVLPALGVFALLAANVPDPTESAYARRYAEHPEELWREEGVQTVVSVRTDGERRVMYLDGLHQASDLPEMVRLHSVMGHLGMVLHPSPRRILVVGLGGGATPGAISRHPSSEITVVELSASVRRAARLFAHVNNQLHERPHVRVRVDDGRSFLRTTRARYDVITADLIQPDNAGAGLVYSVEYFRLVKRALAEGGVVVQWLGRRPRSQYALLMRTFLAVFPNATLWYDGNILVGSEHVADVDPHVVSRVLDDSQLAAAVQLAGLDSIAMLRSWRTAGPRAMAAYAGPGPLLTDDRPLLEYFKSLPVGEPMADVEALRRAAD